MTDVIDGVVREQIWELSRALQLSDADRADRARRLHQLADELGDGGDRAVAVAVIRDLARGLATCDKRRVEGASALVEVLYRGSTDAADRWYELEYVYSQERIDDLEAETMRRLAGRNQEGGE